MKPQRFSSENGLAWVSFHELFFEFRPLFLAHAHAFAEIATVHVDVAETETERPCFESDPSLEDVGVSAILGLVLHSAIGDGHDGAPGGSDCYVGQI
jgi:hypothetical protein